MKISVTGKHERAGKPRRQKERHCEFCGWPFTTTRQDAMYFSGMQASGLSEAQARFLTADNGYIAGMPQLRPRREAFCQAIIRSAKTGLSIAECYESAGYKTTGHGSEVNASRLLKDAEIRSRLDELSRPIVKKMAFTLETLSAEVAATIKDARAKGQNSVVVRALELGAKLHGLLTERVDVNVEVGVTRDEILGRLEQRYGHDAISVLRAALAKGDYSAPLIESRTTRHASPSAGRTESDIILEEMPRGER
jgi:hypothetical protein